VIAKALRLSTNTAEYTHCAGARTPANATSVRVLSERPFAAELEVEPPHATGLAAWEEHGALVATPADAPPRCPVKIQVTWRAGFELTQPNEPRPCPAAKPRLVRIDDDGEIRAVVAAQVPDE
jgi:hypothetical protein